MVDAGDVRAVRLGELDGDGAHPAGRAVDEHPVSGRHPVLGKVVEGVPSKSRGELPPSAASTRAVQGDLAQNSAAGPR